MGIAIRIRELKGGMSIPDFARLIGEDKPQRLQDVLAGRQKAPEDMLVRIVSVTKCDANWLLIGEGLAPEINSRQRALIENYEAADEAGRRLIEGTASLAAQPKAVKPARKKAA